MASIKHPVAYSEAAQAIIRIADAPRSQGMLYICLHCGQRMSAVVLVTQKTPHFRHTAPETQCDLDDALHTYAIKMIQQAHAEARENGVPYTLTRGCRKCGEGYSTNIDLADGWECTAEKSIVPHTRSDLAFTRADGRQLAIEVVNTHEIEPATRTAYLTAQIPVAVVRVTWDGLESLLRGLYRSDTSLNFGSNTCTPCENRQRAKEDQLRLRKATVDAVLSKMSRDWSAPVPSPWDYGRNRTWMYPSTKEKVFTSACILMELGFHQYNLRKPWLFRYPIHKRQRVFLYADLGGSDIIPIYKDTAAMLYVYGSPLSDDDDGHAECCGTPIGNYILEKASERLQRFGVEVRTSFFSHVQVVRMEAGLPLYQPLHQRREREAIEETY